MKLYVFPPSPNSLRCQAVADQAGIDLELVSVDLHAGEQMKDEFIALNPNHKIPVLMDGDFILWESAAIMLYLAAKKPDSGLLPGDERERALCAQWLFWNSAHWGPACAIFTFENLVKRMFAMGEPDAAALEKGKEQFGQFAAVLNDHLKGRDTLIGDRPTVADHGIVSWLVHAKDAQIPVGDYGEIARWSADLLRSDPWQKALAIIPDQ